MCHHGILLRCVGFVSLSICLVVQSEAQLINGSFESGMSGWTTVGPNSSLTSGTKNGFSATNANFYAYMDTGAGSLPVAVQDFILASAGLPASYVASTFPGANEGATSFQTFTLNPGDHTLRFDWNFLSDEPSVFPTENDFAFALLYNNTTTSIAGTAYLDTTSGLVVGSPQFSHELGWQTVSLGGLTGGNSYTLLFGVFDRNDSLVNSGLLIDNITSVPEPSSVLSIVMAGVLATVFRRRFVG